MFPYFKILLCASEYGNKRIIDLILNVVNDEFLGPCNFS